MSNPKVSWVPPEQELPSVEHLIEQDHESIGDITYYAEPERWEPPEFLTSPGVSSAWFLLDGEYLPVAIMTMGDGKANVMRRDL